MSKIGEMNKNIESVVSQVAKIATQVEYGISEAVRGLQFQDIVNQLLLHAKQRVEEQSETQMAVSQLHKQVAPQANPLLAWKEQATDFMPCANALNYMLALCIKTRPLRSIWIVVILNCFNFKKNQYLFCISD